MFQNIEYEKKLWSGGEKLVVGIDEVGRGPLAGPLVVCAVVLDAKKVMRAYKKALNTTRINDVMAVDNFYAQITDSKLVSPNKRCKINAFLINEVVNYSIVEFSNEELDKVGLGKLTSYAFYKALQKISAPYSHVLTDSFPIKQIPAEIQTNIIRGDSLSITVGAASIMAKVYRDNIMIKMHTKYPQYGFDQHKGYGTKKHIEALQKYGPCEIHRKSYEPVKSLIGL